MIRSSLYKLPDRFNQPCIIRRLHGKLIRPRLSGLDGIHGVYFTGCHDDFDINLSIVFDTITDVEPIPIRQHDIQNNDIRVFLLYLFYAGFSILCRDYLLPFKFQPVSERKR
ncbi:MAG: hypothetical protein MJA29_06300, partial [Candidatus Omnitrophica bacterium]|nr:hypothetical protein [Candidatus Omnitrophota bacterium]